MTNFYNERNIGLACFALTANISIRTECSFGYRSVESFGSDIWNDHAVVAWDQKTPIRNEAAPLRSAAAAQTAAESSNRATVETIANERVDGFFFLVFIRVVDGTTGLRSVARPSLSLNKSKQNETS